jgi:pyridoxal phosphate enzyme (YggS family)
MGIAERVQQVYHSMESACKNSGRSIEEVKLIAVSKTFPVEVNREAYDAGLKIFGENKAQDLRDKAPQMPPDTEWHFIGHLQSNKIKYVAGVSALIHSVDSLSLAEAISAFGVKKDIAVPVLLEVNTSGESSKFGLKPEETKMAFEQIRVLENIEVRGLMTIGPLTRDEDKIRASFRQLRTIREELAAVGDESEMAELSMGMSQDYEIAIEEGSTMVRIGTAIFGKRGYKL